MDSASPVTARLVISYILDWIIIIAIAAVGAAFSVITPNKRPFDLANPDIAFPYVSKEKISTAVLVVVSLIAPAIIIFITSLFLNPNPSSLSTNDNTSQKPSLTSLLRRKLWALNAGWMGLALSLALAFLLTNGIKNLVGKPRPDLLARCDPNLDNLLSSTVGGITGQVDEGVNLVSWTICRNPGDTLDEGFRSFPSGHSSFSFAGLFYLSLHLSAKLSTTIPYLPFIPPSNSPHRTLAAAPPTYLLLIPFIPLCAAIYISTTRYSDFYHHGFDIIAGVALGIATAWLGFRWYHLPLRQAGGGAWAPRRPEYAIGGGAGVVRTEKGVGGRDLERGEVAVVGGGAGMGMGVGGRRVGQLGGRDGQTVEMDDLASEGRGVRASDSSRRALM